MTAASVIPASNFIVRKLDGFRVDVMPGRYMLCSGWGLWDQAAQAWVASIRVVEGSTVTVPWAFGTRKVAQHAIHQGLLPGYQVAA